MADILKKLAAVVFLTMLIWAWAYLALEETMDPPPTGTLKISPAIRQDLFVSFEDQPTTVSLKLTIKGPPSKISELTKGLRASDIDPTKERLDFLYDPESQGHSTPGSYVLDVVEFLNKSDKLKDMVTIVSCEPAKINVRVEKLTEKRLTIQCLDVHNALLAAESIEPASIQMFVHDYWSGDRLKATVRLSASAADKARKEPISEKPFIELESGRRIYSKVPVSIKLLSTETPLQDRVTSPLKLGYIFSRNLHGKYTVQLINESDLRTLRYKASERAFIAYENQPYQILIEIHDGDENATEAIHRPVRYDFPEDFEEKGEIELAGPSGEAIFKLVPVSEKLE